MQESNQRAQRDQYNAKSFDSCISVGITPIAHPCGNGHHTELEITEEDRDYGQAAYWLGGLFIDVEDDPSFMSTKMTSEDTWSRVARALRIHGLKIVNRSEHDLPAWAEAERKTLRSDLSAAEKKVAELEKALALYRENCSCGTQYDEA